MFLEFWHKVRHKRAEEVIENNKAVLSSLAVIQHVDQLESSGSLTHEEALRIKHNLLSSVTTLIDSRALIIDIPYEEQVNNVQMLDSFSPKLISQEGEKNRDENDSQDYKETPSTKIRVPQKKNVPRKPAKGKRPLPSKGKSN